MHLVMPPPSLETEATGYAEKCVARGNGRIMGLFLRATAPLGIKNWGPKSQRCDNTTIRTRSSE